MFRAHVGHHIWGRNSLEILACWFDSKPVEFDQSRGPKRPLRGTVFLVVVWALVGRVILGFGDPALLLCACPRLCILHVCKHLCRGSAWRGWSWFKFKLCSILAGVGKSEILFVLPGS